MNPAAFRYVRATGIDDALRLLSEHGENAKLLAGGQSLIPLMKLRFAAPSLVIDLAAVPGLRGIATGDGRVTIGAMTTHAALAASRELRERAPVLADAAGELGDPQVRNRGTLGGACAHGDPAADYPAVMLALGARFGIAARDGRRSVHADDFFTGMFETALGADEILLDATFADAPHSAYVKFHHPASGYAVAAAAVRLDVRAGAIVTARVALTGIGYAPVRATSVEAALAGIRATDTSAVAAACANAAAGVDLRSDAFASAEYRAALADEFVRRAVTRALAAA